MMTRSRDDLGGLASDVMEVARHPTLFSAERGGVVLEDLDPEAQAQARAHLGVLPHAAGLYGNLTARELEILRLIAAGMRNQEIAGQRLPFSDVITARAALRERMDAAA